MSDVNPGKKPAVALWVKRGAAAFVLPVLMLGALEGGLRLLGFGYETDFFVPIEGQEAWTTNPLFARQFFPPALARVPRPARIAFEKAQGTVRILVLGGSAAMGEPEPAYSFGRMLEVLLEDRYPGVRFEVINGAMATINSHVVRLIAEESEKLSPDVVVVYAGNNEVVGPYGAGTVFGSQSQDLRLLRAGIALRRTRVGQLVERWVQSLAGASQFVPEGQGMAMFLDQKVAAWDPRLETVYAHFASNLEAIVGAIERAGAVPCLVTVGSNLLDHAPFASMHRPGFSDAGAERFDTFLAEAADAERRGDLREALALYYMAVDGDPDYAEARYQVARLYAAAGQIDSAAVHAAAARDLDALRFRADSRINDTIRQVAGDRRTQFLDGVAALAGASDRGLPGDDLFYEHVHLRPEGNYVLARAVAGALEADSPAWARKQDARPAWRPQQGCEDALALTVPDAYRMYASISGLMRRAPFTNQSTFSRKRKATQQRLNEMRRRATRAAVRDSAGTVYSAALAARPGDLDLRQNHAQFLQETGQLVDAAAAWQDLLENVPGTPAWQIALATALSDQGAHAGALEVYRDLHARMPGMVLAHIQMGYELIRVGAFEEAASILREGLAANPGSTVARLNLALLLSDLGYEDEARAVLQEGIDLAREHGDRQVEADVAMGLAELDGRDDPAAGLRTAHRALEMYVETRDIDAQVGTMRQMGGYELARGRYDAALTHYSQALARSRNWHLTELEGLSRNDLAACRVAMGDVPGALEDLRKARDLFEQVSEDHPAIADLRRALEGLGRREERMRRGRPEQR